MRTESNRRGGFHSHRVPLIIAVTVATTVLSAGLVLGHRPASEDGSGRAPSSAAPTLPAAASGDPSVPAATDAVGSTTSDSDPPASTF